ncbi:uncharacterized protein [Coffea arabica]|uniref:Uncharacterized protein n=1 Tax=Coffea arabica TaxID=13443 RepID=A0ABM4VBC4_COFAR
MVRTRGGSAGTGRTIRLRDEHVEIVEPSTMKSPRKGIETRGGKRKSSARKKRQTAEPSVEQIEEQQTAEQTVEEQQTAEQTVEEQQTAELSTRKSPRTRSDVPTAQRSGKRKRPAKVQPEAQPEVEPNPLSKFIDDDVRERFELISQKGFITQRTILPSEFRKLDLEHVLKFFEFKK